MANLDTLDLATIKLELTTWLDNQGQGSSSLRMVEIVRDLVETVQDLKERVEELENND